MPVYVLLVVLLRVFGKHALAKSNAYGLDVTVSLGSALASAVLTKEVTLADAVLAIAVLLGLQYFVAIATSRVGWLASVVTQSPEYVVREGRMLEDAMRRERISPQEVFAAVRQAGFDSVEEVYAVVPEADGSMSVIARRGTTGSALQNVRDKKG